MATPGGLVDKQELIDAQLDTAHLGRVVNSKDASGAPINTSTNRTGGVNKTLDALEAEYQGEIANAVLAFDDQRDQFETTFNSQFTYKRIGNISDYAGQSLPEDDKLNSYQYPDDSDAWYAPIQGQTFPITIPADPTVSGSGWVLTASPNVYRGLWSDTGGIAYEGDTYQTQVGGTPTGRYFKALQNTTVDPVADDINWREVVSVATIPDYTDIVYKASGGNSAVENMIAEFSANPLAYAVGTILKTGGTTWEFKDSTGAITLSNFRVFNSLWVDDFIVSGAIDDTSGVQEAINYLSSSPELDSMSFSPREYKISQLNSRMSEKTIYMAGARFTPITENVYMWEHAGQGCYFLGGKFEPESYTSASRFKGIRVFNDSTTPQSSQCTFRDIYMYGLWRSISIDMDETISGANYRHVFDGVRIRWFRDGRDGSWCVSLSNKGQNNNSAGNDTRFVNCGVRGAEYGYLLENGIGTKFVNSYVDNCWSGWYYSAGSHLNITNCYSEYNETGLRYSGGPYLCTITGGSMANDVNISGTMLNNQRTVILGCANLEDSRRDMEVFGGVVEYGGVSGAIIGESDSDLNNRQGIKVRSETGTDVTIEPTVGNLTIKGGSELILDPGASSAPVIVSENGEITLSPSRNLFGNVGFNYRTDYLAAASNPDTSYVVNDSGTLYFVVHSNGNRYRFALGIPF